MVQLHSPATTAWEDTTANVTVNGVTGPVATRQAKSRLLETFKKGNYEQFQEGKLRNGKQLPNESVMEYYYEVVSLCKSLDPNMSDQAKVNYLMGGLKPELTEALYPKRIGTAEEFFIEVKLMEEARMYATSKRGTEVAAALSDTRQEESGGNSDEGDETAEPDGWDQNSTEDPGDMEQLEAELAELILRRNRLKKSMTDEEETADVEDTREGHRLAPLTQEGVGRKEPVWIEMTVNGRPGFRAALDTGASISVVRQELVKELGLEPAEEPIGPEILMADGKPCKPQVRVQLTVSLNPINTKIHKTWPLSTQS